MNIHVIIAPSAYHKDPLKYRRHRLANFLLRRQDTRKVIWVCPEESNLKSIRQPVNIELLANGIIEISVADFKGIIRNLDFFQKNISDEIRGYYDPITTLKLYLWYTYPAFSGLGKLKIWSKIIYDCSDLWSQIRPNRSWFFAIKSKIVERTEHKIIKQSDQCFTTSTFLYNRIKKKHGRVILVENGVDFQRFNSGTTSVSKPSHPPTIGFIGGLKPWKVNYRLMLDIVTERPDWNMIVVGPVYGELTKDIEMLLELPNVKYIPFVPYDNIPEVIQLFDVGLMPYLENDYNKAVVPLKLFEYLAAGVPVVGCGLPSTVGFVGEHVYLHVQSRTHEFIHACKLLMSERTKYIELRKTLAQQADWNRKFETIWNAVSLEKNGVSSYEKRESSW